MEVCEWQACREIQKKQSADGPRPRGPALTQNPQLIEGQKVKSAHEMRVHKMNTCIFIPYKIIA